MPTHYGPDAKAIGNYISHQQTFITDANTQPFLADNERRVQESESASRATVDHICRCCGRLVDSVLQDYCGHRDCEYMAAFGHIKFLPEQTETAWAESLFLQYQHDPRAQIVLDIDPLHPDAPPRTKEPNLMSVMRAISAGAIEEADPAIIIKARQYCLDFHGV